MPTRFRVIVGCLYAVFFSSIAATCLGVPFTEWALAELGLLATLAALATWVVIVVGSLRLINVINDNWPALLLPPEPVYSPEVTIESVLLSTQINVRSVGAPPGQYPDAAEIGQTGFGGDDSSSATSAKYTPHQLRPDTQLRFVWPSYPLPQGER